MTLRRIVCVVAFAAFSASALAQAVEDPSVLVERIRQVEQELADLRAQAGLPPQGPGVSSGGLGAGAIPQSPARYDDLEISLRRVTGQVEELAFQVRRLQEQNAAFQKDTQFRLSALEGGAPSSFAGMPQAAPAAPGGPSGSPPPMSLGSPAAVPAAGPKSLGAPGPGTLGTLPRAADPAAQDTLAAETGIATPEDQYKAALDLLSKQNYPEAQSAFRAFAAANPKHDLAATAQFFAADIDFVQKNYPAAAQGFTAVLRSYPKSTRAPDAMLKLGLSLIQAGDKQNGCLTLAALKAKYPRANAETLARAQRGRTQAGCI